MYYTRDQKNIAMIGSLNFLGLVDSFILETSYKDFLTYLSHENSAL